MKIGDLGVSIYLLRVNTRQGQTSKSQHLWLVGVDNIPLKIIIKESLLSIRLCLGKLNLGFLKQVPKPYFACKKEIKLLNQQGKANNKILKRNHNYYMIGLSKYQAQLLVGFIHKAKGWAIFFLHLCPQVYIIGGLILCLHHKCWNLSTIL